jgi:D-alanine-D-alanine ligase
MLATSSHRRRSSARSASDGPERLGVAVLMGGVGHEREVSLRTGRAVADALSSGGHRADAWVLDHDDDDALDGLPRDLDVVFIALHGDYGEDGRVQAALAARNFTYTGSGPEASARAYDKIRTKAVLARHGVPVAPQRVLPFPFGPRDLRHALRMIPAYPVVVKPARLGSSVGVVVCRDRSQALRALEENARYEQPQLIEEFIPGHELTCGVLGGEALPVVEPVPHEGVYDYRAKYDPTAGTCYRVEPEAVPAATRAEVRRLALVAHEALGCADVSRVDFRYDPTRDRIAALEVNTVPGMTATSLLPKAAAAVGIPFPRLVERICRLAIRNAVR